VSEPKKLFESKLFHVVEKYQHTREGKKLLRHVIEHPGAITILPVLDDGRIVLIRQFRIAVDKHLIELPAGTREPDEPPIETAARELVEETGYRASRIEPMLTFFSSPGILREQMFTFRATGLTPGETDQDEGEEIEPLLVTREETMAMIGRGEIEDAKTLVTLLSHFLGECLED
jgi:ADP-ribose pyrophosphatase